MPRRTFGYRFGRFSLQAMTVGLIALIVVWLARIVVAVKGADVVS